MQGVCADGHVCNERNERQPTHTSNTHTGLHTVTSSHTSVCQSLVSVHTVLSSITTPLHTLTVSHTSRPETTIRHASPCTPTSDWPEGVVLTEFGESGSYDDVILEDISENTPHNSASLVCKTKPPSVLSSTVNQSIRPFVSVNQSASSYSVNQSHDSISLNQSTLSYISVNQSMQSFSINQARPSVSVDQSSRSSSKQLPLPPTRGTAKVTSSFTNKSALTSISPNQSALSSVSINQSCLSKLSANQSAFSTYSSKQFPLLPPRGGVKITSPLCDCGRRSRRLTVCNGGPNHGRAFYTCAGRRSSGPTPHATHPGPAPHNSGCGFFKWKSALIKSSAVGRITSALSFNLSTAASRNFR